MQEDAFNNLKSALTFALVLRIPDFSKPFEVVADASGSAIGAVLLQEDRLVALELKILTPAEKNA